MSIEDKKNIGDLAHDYIRISDITDEQLRATKITRIKSAYYCERCALEILPLVLALIERPESLLFPAEKFKLAPQTLRIKIGQAWAYLIEHGQDIKCLQGKIGDAIPWEQIKIMRQRIRLTPVDVGVIAEIRYKDWEKTVSSIDSANAKSWNVQLREWLEDEDENKKPLVVGGLCLNSDQQKAVKNILIGFGDEIFFTVDASEIKVTMRKDAGNNQQG